MMIIRRDSYLKRLISLDNVKTIKIVTGIRRCGKTYLIFNLFHDYLISQGVAEDHILAYNMEDMSNIELRNNVTLFKNIVSRMVDNDRYYVFIDEIQKVKDFFEVLNSLLDKDNTSVYVTGSNSKFLSKDVVTEFRGRSMEIRMRPLSFSEFAKAKGIDPRDCLDEYMDYGGMPELFQFEDTKDKTDYLKGLVLKVYFTDIIDRYHLKNESDLETITNFLCSSVGSLNNSTKIANTLRTMEGSTITNKTVKSYIDHLCDSFLFEKTMRYDIKGRRYADSISKYYIADIGLKNARENFRQRERTHLMENIVYNELRMRGYDVDVGIVPIKTLVDEGVCNLDDAKLSVKSKKVQRMVSYEIDFVANRGNEKIYIQSAWRFDDRNEERETRPFKKINDSFKKVIIIGDTLTPRYDENGILFIGLINFLTDPDCFRI